MTLTGLAAVTGTILSLLSSVLISATTVLASGDSCGPTLNLTTCAAEYVLSSAFECGTLSVPIDHDHPDKGSLDLWVSRRKANGTSEPVGTLFFNPGGPGEAASTFFLGVSVGVQILGTSLLENYDIVAIDPRGVRYSSPLSCNATIFNNAPNAFATDNSSFAELVDFNKALGASCEALTGPLINFVDSVSTVKDFELVRQALGVDKISYLGLSYGTLLGQTYAELYPEHVDRMALDSIVDHSAVGIHSVMDEAATFETTLKEFFVWCNTTTDCALHGQDQAALFKQLASMPTMPAPNCGTTCAGNVSNSEFLLSIREDLSFFNSSLEGSTWLQLASYLNETLAGDASAFSATLDTTVDNTTNSQYIYRATMCQDWGSPVVSAVDLARILDVVAAQAPLTRGINQAFGAVAYCIGWPAPVRNPPHRLDQRQVAKLPPVMLVNAYWDPQTSPVSALGVRQQLPTAFNVWRNGVGHTSYLLFGETSRAIDAFLVNGTMPADGTVYES